MTHIYMSNVLFFFVMIHTQSHIVHTQSHIVHTQSHIVRAIMTTYRARENKKKTRKNKKKKLIKLINFKRGKLTFSPRLWLTPFQRRGNVATFPLCRHPFRRKDQLKADQGRSSRIGSPLLLKTCGFHQFTPLRPTA